MLIYNKNSVLSAALRLTNPASILPPAIRHLGNSSAAPWYSHLLSFILKVLRWSAQDIINKLWIGCARSAFGLYELPNRYKEDHQNSNHEQFYYVLEGSMDFTVGNDSKKVSTGDIIEIPKGFPYNFSSTKEDPVRFAAVRSNDHLEYLIDNQ